MVIARQSTARTVMVGPVLDADGVAVTGGVVGDFKISKNGGAPAALNGSATLTHRHTGHYSLALTTSDLDTVGQAEIVIDDTVNACPIKVITVIEEAVYDISFAASATGAVPVASIANNAITAAAIATGAIDADAIADNAIDAGAIASDAITAAKIATGAITSAKFAAGAITAAAIATDAIDADALAADAIAEINATVDTAISDAALATAANLATVAGYLDTEIAAILADTNELQTDWANGGRLDLILDARASQTSVDTIDDLLDTEIGALTTELAKVPKSDGTASWNATALASINAQVVDGLNVDTYAEPGQGAPGATLSLAAKIGFLYKAWRNRSTQTASQYSLYNDDASTVDHKASFSDNGTTADRGEIATGP